MREAAVLAALFRQPFDLVVKNVQIVNVFNDSINPGSIGIAGGKIAYIGKASEELPACETIDGHGAYALPGFVDSHMHLESSMLTPDNFAGRILSLGTTTVCADPHEIANVSGREGIKYLIEACRELPLQVFMMAPSTIPSAPGFEDSGYYVDAKEMEALLSMDGVYGLGEVMDFNGVANGEELIHGVVEKAADTGCILDGHVALLSGKGLQVFRAAGIDSDHTVGTAEKLKEELALGFTVQVQLSKIHKELMDAMNEAPVKDRICLVTDDVPLSRLMREGHLNHVVEAAIEAGLDPMFAIRAATINGAVRLRRYDIGAIAPGMRADIQLCGDIRHPRASLVICGGRKIAENGRLCIELPGYEVPKSLLNTMNKKPVSEEDFEILIDTEQGFRGGTASFNIMQEDGAGVFTKHVVRNLPISAEKDGASVPDTEGYLRMAVFNRYGTEQRGLSLIEGMGTPTGALALTYSHDAHNLTVFGGNKRDMAIAANELIACGGGLCAVRGGKVLSLIKLPVSGLLSMEAPEELINDMEELLSNCRDMGFCHRDLSSFFTLMALAVSPEIKLSDKGLIDVVHKSFIPLYFDVKEAE
ncbi:MAG TPA: adenine deaminase [Candidatus Avilachnospira avistercoris]|nr:adenine deaminase [Candidatus Avilachnospira avistercoris]